MCRVLVVDDNADAALSLAMLLRILGQDVRTAPDGHAALATAQEFPPDVAFLDIGMPGMSGYDLARAFRAKWGTTVRLVALTGWGQDDDRRRSHDAGFDEHLTKPADLAALEGLFRRVKR
jgi:CheY-like chemotaxis protein